MDYALSEHQQAFREAAERFAREKLGPHYQRRARQDRIDRAMLKEMGDLGLIGVDLPEKYGGLGGGSATSELSGYSVLTADSLSGAAALAKGCPVLEHGGSVEVYETIDVM